MQDTDATMMTLRRSDSAAVAGGAVSTQAPALAFYALCAADPMAWIAADAVLCVPLIRNILRMNYGYLHSSRM